MWFPYPCLPVNRRRQGLAAFKRPSPHATHSGFSAPRNRWRRGAAGLRKTVRLPPCFHVEVVPTNDAFGIAPLNRRLADGAQFRDEHGNERMAPPVVREVELILQLGAPLLE